MAGLGDDYPTPAKTHPRTPGDTRPASPQGPDTPPKRLPPRPLPWIYPALRRITAYAILSRPLRITEICGSLATGLEALFRVGYAVASYIWTDTVPVAQAAVAHRLTRLRATYPHLLPSETKRNLAAIWPMDIISITPDVFNATLPEGVDIIMASPPRMTRHYPNPYRGINPHALDATQRLAHLIFHLSAM